MGYVYLYQIVCPLGYGPNILYGVYNDRPVSFVFMLFFNIPTGSYVLDIPYRSLNGCYLLEYMWKLFLLSSKRTIFGTRDPHLSSCDLRTSIKVLPELIRPLR